MTYAPYIPAPSLDLWYGTRGPRDAKIVVVAESWGHEEYAQKVPLVGQSGQEFDRILTESGIDPKTVFFTNCFAAQPPNNEAFRFFEAKKSGVAEWRGLHPTPWIRSELSRLQSQLATLSPTLVIAAGNYAMWALTEGLVSFGSEPVGDGATVSVPTGISSWRGSMLVSESTICPPEQMVLPIIHPASILRQWTQRAVTVHDLLSRVPLALSGDWRPNPPPTIYATPIFEQARKVLSNWLVHAACGNLLRLSNDIETARGLITCMALADGPYSSGSTALVIPFVRPTSTGAFESYWSPTEEFEITKLFRALMTYPNVRIEGQNYNYDTQWIEDRYSFVPNLDFDTMLAHHLLWPGTPKALDYISSLYNKYYWYWKDDNKEWDLRGNFEAHLRYNAEDALRTYECATVLRAEIISQGFQDLWEVEKQKNSLALDMMRRGILIDKNRRAEMAFELMAEKGNINSWLRKIMPQSFLGDSAPKSSKKCWWESTHQQKTLFYDVLGLPLQKKRSTGQPTLDAEALESLASKFPEFTRIWNALSTQRSISVFHDTFVTAELEPDGRMKCSFNTAGTETFRWSSSTNAFWRGTNLQNIPKGEEKDD